MRSRLIGLFAAAVAAVALTGCGLLGAEEDTYEALFVRAMNLFEGAEVKVLGLTVGEVQSLESAGQYVRATFTLDDDVELPANVTAEIKPLSFFGERFIQLDPPYDGGPTLEPGEEIPLDRTKVPAEIDEVLDSFEQFASAIEGDTLSDLVDVLAETLAGQGPGVNQLLDEGSEAMGVLAEASDDLVVVAEELGQLNETVAVKDDQLRQMIRDWVPVFQTFSDESDEIVDGIFHLRRLATELRSQMDNHSDDLVMSLEQLTTTMSTVERNLERVGLATQGSRKLFEAAGRIIEFEEGRVRLVTRTFTELDEALGQRLNERLAGACIRLGADECADPAFFEGLVPDDGEGGLASQLEASFQALPDDVAEQLEAEAAEREAEHQRQQEQADQQPEPEPDPELPQEDRGGDGGIDLPDSSSSSSDSGLRDRMSRMFGGRS